MTGPEHYQEAERLAKVAADEPEFNSERVNYCLASAQVHATLALAAATMDVEGATSNGVLAAWSEAISA